jgi:hypothetical protein
VPKFKRNIFTVFNFRRRIDLCHYSQLLKYLLLAPRWLDLQHTSTPSITFIGSWFSDPTFTRPFDISAYFVMAKKGKKLTRKERKAAKEGENTSKKPTKEREKASRKSPDETEKPIATDDGSDDDKILHPVDIAHDARHFINEIAGSEKTLQEEYNTEVEFLKSGKSDRQE